MCPDDHRLSEGSDPPCVCFKPIKAWCALSSVILLCLQFCLWWCVSMSLHMQSWFWAGLGLWWSVTVCLMCVWCSLRSAVPVWSASVTASAVHLETTLIWRTFCLFCLSVQILASISWRYADNQKADWLMLFWSHTELTRLSFTSQNPQANHLAFIQMAGVCLYLICLYIWHDNWTLLTEINIMRSCDNIYCSNMVVIYTILFFSCKKLQFIMHAFVLQSACKNCIIHFLLQNACKKLAL